MTFKTRPDKWTDDDLLKMVSMHKSGATLEEICSEFPNRKPKNVQNKMHRLGFSAKFKAAI